MITTSILQGDRITLRQILVEDCTLSYVNWLNDPEVNRFLESRWREQTIDGVKEYVKEERENDHSYLMAVLTNDDNRHIGNIKIGPIDNNHHCAEIGYCIGEKAFWGRGIGTEMIRLMCSFAFENIGLHKVHSGVYAPAIQSWKALERNGFIREGVLRDGAICESGYVDVYYYGLLHSEFKGTK